MNSQLAILMGRDMDLFLIPLSFSGSKRKVTSRGDHMSIVH